MKGLDWGAWWCLVNVIMGWDEWLAISLFIFFVVAAFYYSMQLILITRVWRAVWYWFMGAVTFLGVSRSFFFWHALNDLKCPDTALEHALYLYAPVVGAVCLFMALRTLFKMFYRYMDMDYLRSEILRMDKNIIKDKNK